jgi:hypothetical protein
MVIVVVMKKKLSRTSSIYCLSTFFDDRTLNSLIKNNIKNIGDFLELNKSVDNWIIWLGGIWRKGLKNIRYVCNKLLYEYEISGSISDSNELKEEFKEDLNLIYYKGKRISMFYSIIYLDFEIKVLNSLYKNNVFTIKDLINYYSFSILNKKNILWLGANAIDVTKNIVDKFILDNKNKLDVDILTYIKEADHESLFNANQFNLNKFLLDFLDNLSPLELDLLNYRMLFLNEKSKKTFQDLAKNHNLTNERVRQIEESLEKKIKDYVQHFFNSEVWNKTIDYLVDYYWNDVFFVFPKDNVGLVKGIINSQFMVFALKQSLAKRYFFVDIDEQTPIKKTIIIDSSLIKKNVLLYIIKSFDKLYNKDRKSNITINFRDFIIQTFTQSQSPKDLLMTVNDNNYYEKIFKTYILEKYNITYENWEFVLQINKRDFRHIVIEELKIINNPIHFTKLFEVLQTKYPQYKWKENTILSILIKHEYSTNVWLGLYVYKKWSKKYEAWTICELAEKFILNTEGKSASLAAIIKYIQKNRFVHEKSVSAVLFSNNNINKFVKLKDKRVGLQWYRYTNIVDNRSKKKQFR